MHADDLMPHAGDAHAYPLSESPSRVGAMVPCAITYHADAVAGGILASHQLILKLEVGTPRQFDIALVALPVHSARPVLLFSTGNITVMTKMLNRHCCGTEGTGAARPQQRDLSPSRRPLPPPGRPREAPGGVATALRVLARTTSGWIELKTSDRGIVHVDQIESRFISHRCLQAAVL
jgi:hypothetical protein